MLRDFAPFLAVLVMSAVLAACQSGPTIAPLAPDMRKWIAERGETSCSSLQPKYRIAAGVRTSIGLPQYRAAVLDEMSGSGRPPMKQDEALALSSNAAKLLKAEISRRCPKQRVKGKEDIVYVPQLS